MINKERNTKQGNNNFKTTLYQIDADMHLTYFCKKRGVKYVEK